MKSLYFLKIHVIIKNIRDRLPILTKSVLGKPISLL